jgi:RimJ/RimL family protein N-acetyltransferase
MSAFSAALDNDFKSKRLAYTLVEDEDDDYKSFLKEMINEPSLQALSSEMITRPQGKKDIEFLAAQYRKALLGVAICLQPSEEQSDEKTNKKKPTLIGTLCIGWGGIPDSLRHHRNAYIGITLAKQYRGKGYGKEALNWGMDWAFRHAGLHTLSLTTTSFNQVGINLYKSTGFSLDGRRREVVWCNRQWHDELTFNITEGEWETLRGIEKD